MWLLTMRQRWQNRTNRSAQSKPRSWLKTFLEHSLLLSYVTGSGCPEGLRADCAWEAGYSSTEEWERGHRGANEWSLSLLAHITTQDCLEFLSHSLDLKCPSHYWPDTGGRIYDKLQVFTEKYFSKGHTTTVTNMLKMPLHYIGNVFISVFHFILISFFKHRQYMLTTYKHHVVINHTI